MIDEPNNVVNSFNGVYKVKEKHDANFTRDIEVENRNILLKGMSLQNTTHIDGIAVYTGMETKIMKNMVKPKYKFSRLEVKTSGFVLKVFMF
jgi:magnesium-transporting ATPase (P-type)